VVALAGNVDQVLEQGFHHRGRVSSLREGAARQRAQAEKRIDIKQAAPGPEPHPHAGGGGISVKHIGCRMLLLL
jgi:hypothetical protein